MSQKEDEIPKKLDRYELHERIGAGGMGLIYKGLDTRLKRPVAIKIISDRVKDPSVRKNIQERFFNEARAAGGLPHPNLVQIYDFGEIDHISYIIMEYIEGETLENLIKSKGPLNLEELLRVTKEVASGLAFAHKKGIVHRDIKPSNIIIEAHSGVAKILDFGIAKFVNEEEMKLTSTGMVLGSTHYLSPEHIVGKNLDGRSDVFCLGTLLYEASTGTLPFRGANSSSILYKIVHFDPQPPVELRPDLLPQLSNLIMKCLKKTPVERYQKCEEIEKEISQIQMGIISDRGNSLTGAQKISAGLKSYFVRDSQILSTLQSQKKLTSEQVSKLRGKAAVETILREELISEDELAKVLSECLSLPWIPRGRIKSLKISDPAFSILSPETIKDKNILPFFRDNEKKSISLIIDGCTDFQKDPEIADLNGKFQLHFYVCGQQTLKKLIDAKIRQKQNSSATSSMTLSHIDTAEQLAAFDQTERRVLLIDNQPHHHEALVKLFKRNENSLILASNHQEAAVKLKREKFDYVWASRTLIGDELEFELSVLRHNPSCEIRLYDQLSLELFQESITYKKYREFFNRIVHMYLGQGTKAQKDAAIEFASLGAKIAKTISESIRSLDEVYFACLFWKWEKITAGQGKSIDVFDGVCRIRHIFDAIGERFDGRGPLGLKEYQIPLGSRILTALLPLDALHPTFDRPWTVQEVTELKKKYDQYSGKQLDPQLTAAILDMLQPTGGSAKKTKIVIVDSDSQYSARLAAQLKGISADAKVYSDGVSALAGIKKDKPDLVISEIMVSKLDGFSLCARLRADELLSKIPVVFLSESNAPEHSTKAIQLGAEDFLSKTSEPQFILAKLERMLKKVG
ncbi:MAG: protein kinase [Deltaproteobacteria bacterium]|nr:protein kinase [Deltaproteobacteria bacterium]